MAKVTYQVENPDNVELTMQLTLPLKQWREFTEMVEQMGMNKYPLSSLYVDVRRALGEVTRTVEKRIELPQGGA